MCYLGARVIRYGSGQIIPHKPQKAELKTKFLFRGSQY